MQRARRRRDPAVIRLEQLLAEGLSAVSGQRLGVHVTRVGRATTSGGLLDIDLQVFSRDGGDAPTPSQHDVLRFLAQLDIPARPSREPRPASRRALVP